MQQKGKMPELNRVTDYIWDIPIDYMEKMRVPGRLFLSPTLLKGLEISTLNCRTPTRDTDFRSEVLLHSIRRRV